MHQKKLARVLDLIINEEIDSASLLLHEILVDKARNIYEDVMGNEEEIDEEECEDGEEEALEEAFGEGDEKEGFAADVAQDVDDIDADEQDDLSDADGEGYEAGEEGEEFGDEESEEASLESLSAQLAELQASFDELMSVESEEHEGEFGDEMGGDEFGGDEEYNFAEPEVEEGMYMGEATKFSNDVATPEMKDKAANKASPYTKAPSKQDFGGKPTNFAKSSGDGKQADKTAKKEKVEDNIDVPSKNQSADLKGEGKYSAKGGSSGAVQGKSPLSKKPK